MMVKNTKKIDNSMNKAVELTQEAAKATLQGAVGTVEMSENMVQGLYKVGYDANVDALKVAKGYWDATSEIRQDWVKLFAASGESMIDGAANLEVPYQKEVMDFGQGIVNNFTKTFSSFIPQTKRAK